MNATPPDRERGGYSLIKRGGKTPYTYSVTTLPDGLSFVQDSRTITGTPAKYGTTDVTYTVTDGENTEASDGFTIIVNPADLELGDTTGLTAKVGELFTHQLPAVRGGKTPYTYSVTTLPDGLSFVQDSRTITGTPAKYGTTDVTYTVTDGENTEASDGFTIIVNPADLELGDTTGLTAKVGELFTHQLPAVRGGKTPYTYSVTTLPDGLSFVQDSRTITGTPTQDGTEDVGTYDVTYTVTDGDNNDARDDFTITVEADLKPTLGSIDDSSAKLTKVFTLRLPAGIGGDGDLEYDATGRPPGLSFVESSRTITGTPSTAGDYQVTYTASDEDEDVARQTFHIVVYALPSLPEVADVMATKDEVFTLVLTARGGKEPFTYTVTGLPTGLSFDKPSLTIIGTPTQIQVADVTFAVEDDDGDTASQEFQISVSEGDTEPTFPYTIPDLRIASG